LYDSSFLVRISFEFATRQAYAAPGSGATVWLCALVETVLAVIVEGILIILIFFAAVEEMITWKVGALLWAVIGLSIGPIVAGAVGIAAALLSVSPTQDVNWFHAADYNKTKAVQTYVDGAKSYSPVRSSAAMSFWSAVPQADISDNAWERCGHGKDPHWFENLLSSPPNNASNFTYSFTKPGPNPPWCSDKEVSPWEFLNWSDLYTTKNVTACSGVKFNANWVKAAQDSKDLSRLS
jgi:hypothetical protein